MIRQILYGLCLIFCLLLDRLPFFGQFVFSLCLYPVFFFSLSFLSMKSSVSRLKNLPLGAYSGVYHFIPLVIILFLTLYPT